LISSLNKLENTKLFLKKRVCEIIDWIQLPSVKSKEFCGRGDETWKNGLSSPAA
jgi:hypothetical protein